MKKLDTLDACYDEIARLKDRVAVVEDQLDDAEQEVHDLRLKVAALTDPDVRGAMGAWLDWHRYPNPTMLPHMRGMVEQTLLDAVTVALESTAHADYAAET